MDLYKKVAYENSRHLTLRYSTSFGISSRFFSRDIRHHIYAIYAMVRIADEIVDTYKGKDSLNLLNKFEEDVYSAIKSGYSTDLVIHAFAQTARHYKIEKDLISPFFVSMRMDLAPKNYNSKLYAEYIHGSAEVVGLMCLKVFVGGDKGRYAELQEGAASLGSAYQKVNFLRDMAADYKELGRVYFPGVTFNGFNEGAKQKIIDDIYLDFNKALPAINALPRSSRRATQMSYIYYTQLLKQLSIASAEQIKQRRIRVSSIKKALLFVKGYFLNI